MQSSDVLVRRVLRFVVLAVPCALASCEAEEISARLVIRRDEAMPPPPADVGSTTLTPETITIVGTLASERGGRRDLTVVDGRGRRAHVRSDERGSFSAPDVMPPYDLGVLPKDGSAMVVYQGLWRSDPLLDLFDRAVTVDDPSSRMLRLSVRLGQSPCARASGWVTVATVSPAGGGGTVVRCASGAKAVTVDIEHAASAAALAAKESVDVHVLVENDASTTFAYGRRRIDLGEPLATSDVGSVEPTRVPVAPAMSVMGGGDLFDLPDWTWITSLELDVGDDAIGKQPLFHAVTAGNVSERALPLIPGATVRASVLGRHPKADGQTGFYRSTEAWSAPREVSAEPIVLGVVAGPELVHPREAERLPSGDFAFAWVTPTGAAGTVGIVSVTSLARSALVLRVVTAETDVRTERLEAVGVPALEKGAHLFELAAWPSVTTDDMTSPERTTRATPFDRSRSGSATLLRVPFEVGD